MAKQKTKEVTFGNIATEIAPGTWEWKCGSFQWRYRMGIGLNFGPVVDNVWQPQVYIKDVQQAATFAEGFAAGQQFATNALIVGQKKW